MKGIRILNTIVNGNSYPVSHESLKGLESNFYTVVIGNNAAGKSRLLVNILNVLRQATNPRLKVGKDDIEVELLYDGIKYNVGKYHSELFNDFHSDINLLSISNSLFDKFPLQARSDKYYSYIGTRMTGISTHRSAIINDLMDIFSVNLDDISFVDKAKQLFEFLNIDPVIKISLRNSNYSKNSEFFKNTKSLNDLKTHLLNLSKQGFYRQQSSVIEKYATNDEFITGFYEYITLNISELTDLSKRQIQYHEIHLDSPSSNKTFINEYTFFSLLRRLNILTYDYIKLSKGKFEYDILESSTGEIGLLITFLRAIPEMKSNSVIFIDEPEISLHPSWQMKYIALLKSFLKGYTGCHIFIATHSHFLLSDLKESFSSVVVLSNKDGQFNVELKEHTPYGWPPEAILYEIFGVANVRNHYFEYDLKKMLSLISKRSKDYKEIQGFIDKFKLFKYSNGDPLQLIIKEAEDYVKKKN